MPTYTYECECGTEERNVPIPQRDGPLFCKSMQHKLTRVGVESKGMGAPLLYSESSPGTRAADKAFG